MVAIISDVIVVGDTAAYSPDGMWFAFSARPTDGTQGPDIYVWHVGDLSAHPITTDHASVFSAWFGSLILGSSVLPDQPPGVSPGSAAGSPGPEASGLPGESGSPIETLPTDGGIPTATPPTGTSGPDASGSPASTPAGSSGTDQGVDQGVGADTTGPGACCLPVPSPSSSVPTGSPISFLLDPLTGGRAGLWAPAWRPVLDPTGRYVVYWTGTLGFDATTSTWTPLDGQLVIAPWSWLATGGPQATTLDGGSLVLPEPSPAPGSDGSSQPFGWPAATDGADAASNAPVASATPTPPDLVTPAPSELPPADGASPAPTPVPTPFTPLTSPEPLLAPAGDVPTAPFHEWEVRWDPTGARLAVWIGDALDPRLGRLSLLTIDQPTGRVDRADSLLLDAPALNGFSIADGRLAWASPPGQDGEGSRLLIIGWNALGAGQLDGQPVLGSDEVVVVRG